MRIKGFSFSESNKKMGRCGSFSVMPGITCAHCNECYKDCYSRKMIAYRKTVRQAYEDNTKALMIDHRYDEFVKAYSKKYGKVTPDQAAALGFDAYMLAINAMERAGSVDGTKVRDAIAQTKNFAGASGVITFNNGGKMKTFFFFFCHTCSMWKFLAPGMEHVPSSNPSRSSDNTKSLIH